MTNGRKVEWLLTRLSIVSSFRSSAVASVRHYLAWFVRLNKHFCPWRARLLPDISSSYLPPLVPVCSQRLRLNIPVSLQNFSPLFLTFSVCLFFFFSLWICFVLFFPLTLRSSLHKHLLWCKSNQGSCSTEQRSPTCTYHFAVLS